MRERNIAFEDLARCMERCVNLKQSLHAQAERSRLSNQGRINGFS